MARGTRSILSSCRHFSTPSPSPPTGLKCMDKKIDQKKSCKLLDKNDWEDAVCPVCMEAPHNAVLLLCSSHANGCRPYMCGSSYHCSNCLDQFVKAHAKPPSHGQGHVHGVVFRASAEHSTTGAASDWSGSSWEVTDFTCPLCRGPVTGWTVIDAARQCLDAKKRSCIEDGCSFEGTYSDLQKHVSTVHPSAEPHKLDPILQHKWRILEHERELEDVISAIRSSMPGAVIIGDFVVDMGPTMRLFRVIKKGIMWCIKVTGIGLVCYYSYECFGRHTA